MKIIIYGFKPYNGYKTNISEKVVKKVRNRKNLKKIVFKVEFNRSSFVNWIKKVRPAIIIGLGQTSKGRKIRIERRAINLRRKEGKKDFTTISKRGSRYLFVNLKLQKEDYLRVSYDAGKYVCNYSMYVIAEFLKTLGKKVKFAFVHIPSNYKIDSVVEYIEKIIRSVQY